MSEFNTIRSGLLLESTNGVFFGPTVVGKVLLTFFPAVISCCPVVVTKPFLQLGIDDVILE